MSTRATILIKKGKEKYRIYHHCDGYPEGIGRDLKAYLDELKNYVWYPDKIANHLIKGYVAEDDGYELTNCQHGDEEYAYLIDCDIKTLKCYEIGWEDTNWTEDKLVEIP